MSVRSEWRDGSTGTQGGHVALQQQTGGRLSATQLVLRRGLTVFAAVGLLAVGATVHFLVPLTESLSAEANNNTMDWINTTHTPDQISTVLIPLEETDWLWESKLATRFLFNVMDTEVVKLSCLTHSHSQNVPTNQAHGDSLGSLENWWFGSNILLSLNFTPCLLSALCPSSHLLSCTGILQCKHLHHIELMADDILHWIQHSFPHLQVTKLVISRFIMIPAAKTNSMTARAKPLLRTRALWVSGSSSSPSTIVSVWSCEQVASSGCRPAQIHTDANVKFSFQLGP